MPLLSASSRVCLPDTAQQAKLRKHANLITPTGIKAKVENKEQYEQYLAELKPVREDLGIPLKEDLYPEAK